MRSAHYDRQYRLALIPGMLTALLVHATLAFSYRVPGAQMEPAARTHHTEVLLHSNALRMVVLPRHGELRVSEEPSPKAPTALMLDLPPLEMLDMSLLQPAAVQIEIQREVPRLPESARATQSPDPQRDFSRYVGLTPSMVAPRLVNATDLQAFVRAAHDEYLHRYSVSPEFAVYFWIDEEGRAQRSELFEPQGPGTAHPALAQLATRLHEVTRFTPARDRGRTVAIKVSVPILLDSR
jgi:hypothetical protein